MVSNFKKILFLGLILICSCRSAQVLSDSDPVIKMTRTQCFGTCPAYTISIYEDRKVMFEGEMFVEPIGLHYAELDRTTYKNLVKAFRSADFFSFEDEYTENVSDLPTIYLSFSDQGQTKTITDHVGAPEELKSLERMVGDLIKQLKFTSAEK